LGRNPEQFHLTTFGVNFQQITGSQKRTAVHKSARAAAISRKLVLNNFPMMQRCHWVNPVPVAQVKFTEWTHDDQLRQPVFLGLRTDKEAKDLLAAKVR